MMGSGRVLAFATAALTGLFALSCSVVDANQAAPSGMGGGATAGAGGTAPDQPVSCPHALTRRVRRLSAREYLNVLTDLLGESAATAAKPLLPFEPRLAGFDNQDGGLLVSAAYQEALFNIAEKVAGDADPVALAPCAAGADAAGCLSAFAQSFARRAYGRAPTGEESSRLLAAGATGTDYATSVRLVIEAVLQSPNTVYATELGPLDAGKTGAEVALAPHEVASQMSLVLTAARPDEALLAAVDAGQLSTADELRAQLTRLLATPRAQQQLRHFIDGWLDIGPVADAPKDGTAFPDYTPALAEAMQQELDQFIDAKIAGGSGTLLSLFTDASSNIPPALAPIYAATLTPNGLDPARRKGILSLPGLLTYHSADQHSGPIERGLFVKRQLFCQVLPPPPASVLDRLARMPLDTHDTKRTTRQKYEMHVNEPFCAGCHDQFDGIGFGLEEMDALGRYRTTENGLPVDSSGNLVGTDVDGPFNGVVELTDKLAKSELIRSCFTQHFFRFSASRPPNADEQCVVDAWSKTFSAGGTHLQDLLLSWLTDPRFGVRKEDR